MFQDARILNQRITIWSSMKKRSGERKTNMEKKGTGGERF